MSIKGFGGDTAVSAVSQGLAVSIIGTLATVVGGMISARVLGADGRGELAALVTLPTFMSFVATLGLPSALVYEVRRSPAASRGLHAAALVLALVAGLGGAAIAWAAAPKLLTQLRPELMSVARLLVAFTVLGLLSNTGLAALQAHCEFKGYNAIRLAQPLLQLTALACLAAFGVLTPVSAALATLGAGLPGILCNLEWLRTRCRLEWSQLAGPIRRLTGYGMRAAGGEMLVGLAGQLDKVILVGLFAPATMGLYVVAMSLSRVLSLISGAVAPVLFPIASGRSAEAVIAVTSRAAAVTALLVGSGSIVLVAIGPWLLAVFYGPDFREADWAFRLLVVEAAIGGMVQVLGQAFLALDRPGLATVQYGLGALVAAALLIALTPHFGLVGAAVALLLAGVVRLACSYWCFAGILHLPAPRIAAELVPSLSLLRAALASVWR